jgi:hypothetical protein
MTHKSVGSFTQSMPTVCDGVVHMMVVVEMTMVWQWLSHEVSFIWFD